VIQLKKFVDIVRFYSLGKRYGSLRIFPGLSLFRRGFFLGALALFAGTFLVLSVEASEFSATAIRERGVLQVALEDDGWAYFLQWNGEKPSGFCVDLAEALGEALGVSCSFVSLPWGDGEPGSISGILRGAPWGAFDIIASVATINSERSRFVHFSEPYATVGQMVFFRRGGMRLLSPEALQGKRIGFAQDTTSEPAARSLPGSNELVPLENASAVFRAFETSEIDAVVIDSPLAFLFLRDHPEADVLDKLLTRENYGLVLPLSADAELREIADRVVLEQREALENRWIP